MFKYLLIFLFICTFCYAGVDFDGTDDFLWHADGEATDLNGVDQHLTISCWVRRDEDGGTYDGIVSKDDETNGERQFWLGEWVDDKIGFILSPNGSSLTYGTGATTLTIGTWFHIVMVYNDIDIRLYVDGLLDTNSSNPKAHTTGIYDGSSLFRIGSYGREEVAYRFFGGVITDVAMWDCALSAVEVFSIYSSKVKGFPLQIQPANLVLYLPMDETADGVSADGVTSVDRSDSGTDVVGDDGGNDSGLTSTGEDVLTYPPSPIIF